MLSNTTSVATAGE